jgi:hypothetical protein
LGYPHFQETSRCGKNVPYKQPDLGLERGETVLEAVVVRAEF